MNEFLHGSIWVYSQDGIPTFRFPLVLDEPVLCELNQTANEMFSSYGEFDSHDAACQINMAGQRVRSSAPFTMRQKDFQEIHGFSLTQPEGFVAGMAAKMFQIAGPVIVFGVSASVVYGIVLAILG